MEKLRKNINELHRPFYYSTLRSHRFFADPYEIYKLELIQLGGNSYIAIQKYTYNARLNQYCQDTGLLFEHAVWHSFLHVANLFSNQYLGAQGPTTEEPTGPNPRIQNHPMNGRKNARTGCTESFHPNWY